MSIVTYILLAALHAGINSRFNPVVSFLSLFVDVCGMRTEIKFRRF